MGRPLLVEGQALTAQFGVRLSKAEAKTVEAAVKHSGLDRSKWLRVAIIEAARAPLYTHKDAQGVRWRFVGSRPVSEIADKVLNRISKRGN